MIDGRDIPEMMQIFNQAWAILKKHHAPKTDSEWDAFINDLEDLVNIGSGIERKFALELGYAMTRYFEEVK